MDGYLVLYDTLIFFPAGILLGTIARKEPSRGACMAATAISWDSAAARALSVHSRPGELEICFLAGDDSVFDVDASWRLVHQCRPQRWSFVSCSAKIVPRRNHDRTFL